MLTATARRVVWCVLGALAACAGRAADAQAPTRGLAQFVHRAWTVRDGAPGSAVRLAQTDDGTLWIGTAAGLYRFDGVRFERFEPPAGRELPAQGIPALRAFPGGDLWIGYNLGGASVLAGGRLVHYGEREGLGRRAVLDFARDSAGTVWLATTGDLARLVGGRWQTVGVEDGFEGEGAISLLVDRRGTLWAASGGNGVHVLPRGARRFTRWRPPRPVGERDPEVWQLSQAPDGSVWGADWNRGLILIADAAGRAPAADAPRYRDSTWRGVTIDSRGDAWLHGKSGQLVRVSTSASGRAETLALAPSAPLSGDVLTGDVVLDVLEDREGSVWLATNRGLDQLREARLTPLPPSLIRPGEAPALAAGDGGTVWLAAGADSTLLAVGDRIVAHPQVPSHGVTCMHRDQDGGIWVGGKLGLWHRPRGGAFTPIALPDSLMASPAVLGIARDGEGALWVATMRGGLFRRRAGRWQRFGPRTPRGRAVVADRAGRAWVGYEDGHIARITGDAVRRFTAADGLRLNTVVALAVRGDRVWASGDLGVASLEAGRGGARFVPLALADGAPRGVSGIVETADGELWLHDADGVLRVPNAELRRARRDTAYRAWSERFDYRDGRDGVPRQGYPLPTAIEGTDGRLWFTTNAGAVWVDPRHVRRNPVPPTVQIRGLVADGRSYAPAARVTLPRRTTALRVAYTAPSLAVPERVRFRYRLAGLDTAWQDAGARREAFYTNLGPGPYRFEVRAANDDGVWSPAGAALDVVIPPTFVQTNAFLALCAAAAGGAVWSLAAWRQRRLAAADRARLEAALAERVRVARELHDTLLSDLAGVTMQLDAAVEATAAGAPGAGPDMDVAVVAGVRDQARRALDEARRAVVGLRAAPDDLGPLGAQLRDAARRIFAGTDVDVRVEHTGAVRRYAPAVEAEALRVAAEAMTNARQHAGSRTVTVSCAYGGRTLAVRVRDDGRGFDPVAAGGDGHYGLTGMGERAVAIGARLAVESAPGRGTEVALDVPVRPID